MGERASLTGTQSVTNGNREPGESAAVGNAMAGDRTVHVRPLRYVEDHAVVRQVGDRDLFLGNAHAADPAVAIARSTPSSR